MVIAFVGLSNKPDKAPLDSTTKSGALIDEIEKEIGFTVHRTNLCKFAPLDENKKLRYPTISEMNESVKGLLKELESIKADKVFLLGNKVTDTIRKYASNAGYELEYYKLTNIAGTDFIPVHHPAYVAIYRPMDREKYINDIIRLVNKI